MTQGTDPSYDTPQSQRPISDRISASARIGVNLTGKQKWGLIFGVYSLVALFFITQTALSRVTDGESVPWWQIIGPEAIYWYLWAAITPFIFTTAARFRIERSALRETLPAHLGLMLGLAVIQNLVWLIFLVWIRTDSSLVESIRALQSMESNIVAGTLTGFYKYWLIVLFFYLFDYYRRFRSEERAASESRVKSAQLEQRLTEAKLDSLKAKLQPHFLFNTLNAISLLMREDTKRANRMLLRLSELLRVALQHAEIHEVPLFRELELIRKYMDIQSIRFEDRLRFREHIAPNVLDAIVPYFILQPIVENAVRHGVEPQKGTGTIEIRANVVDGILQLQVKDSGKGEAGSEVEKRTSGHGMGLTNTRDRLREMYGNSAELTLKIDDQGTLATIRIPLRRHPGDNNAPHTQ